MRKILTGILVLAITLIIFFVFKKQTLAVPEYPLDADTIGEALQEWGLSYTIQEDDLRELGTQQEQSLFSLYSIENGKFVAGISSGYKNGERILFISFPAFNYTNAISSKECEDTIVFATNLFGGFKSSHQVYDNFVQDYDTVNTKKVQYEISDKSLYPMREAESHWESNIGGTTCRITLEQPTLSEPQEYLRVIIFASDWDTFFSE